MNSMHATNKPFNIDKRLVYEALYKWRDQLEPVEDGEGPGHDAHSLRI